MRVDVRLHAESVGELSVGSGGAITFRFHDSYVDRPARLRPVLGQAFEENLRRSWKSSQRLPEFFSNLLPEGALRQLVAKQVGVPEHRELQLLLRLGQDLPGAITIAADVELDDDEPSVPEQRPDAESTAGLLRFSLAGVQTKFSVLRHADKFTFPARGWGGDWIVKLPDLEFDHVPENECSMMTWARAAGLMVPQFQLVDWDHLDGLPAGLQHARRGLCYAIERFDRDGEAKLHIEDFAQVFSVYPEAKYDHFNYESIAKFIAAECGEVSLREYVRRLVFMVVSGNADMHLKNWSLRYMPDRSVELSPAYDMVSTVVYPDVKRELALRFSRSQSFDAVDIEHFRRMFERIGRDPNQAQQWVEDDLGRVLAAWQAERERLPLGEDMRRTLDDHMQRLLLVRQFNLRPR